MQLSTLVVRDAGGVIANAKRRARFKSSRPLNIESQACRRKALADTNNLRFTFHCSVNNAACWSTCRTEAGLASSDSNLPPRLTCSALYTLADYTMDKVTTQL